MSEQTLFKVTIDNITIEVPAGTTILNAARKIGGDVAPPAMCYYSKLEGSGGKCRTCLVEVSKGSEKDPRPMPKLVASCRTTVMDGMEVKNITSDRVIDARNGVVEFLLINHPLDCPVCDQAGECHLQDLSYEHGKAGTRYEFQRRTFKKHDLGDKIQLHMTRCILCYRCVFTADQLTGKREHGVLDRGDHAEIATYIEKNLDNEFIGNVIDVCPVGALTDKTFRFKNRVWFLKPVDAHRDCPTCSGKVTLWNRGDEVYRVTARKDQWGEVEDWICNTCRFDKKQTSDWVIEGPRLIDRHSVIAQGHYAGTVGTHKPTETFEAVHAGRQPKLLMDIHSISEVNQTNITLSKLDRPAHSTDFNHNKD
ncbi:MAG: Fe-S-binding domain-containing protein [Sphingobacteriia bacterium 24-36-13]|jgi:NADH-quinone oxidoreductase subunit G|uniref:2Fe-2S iron-sulfur cluster-binding protein n=1 Tax=Sediminibacterium sp. TaxID=1917865 RepID=UPI000BC7442D|nr:2Fe-2S iron-sulfur cluster-binding protein [Sediminibacterium sp.]OYY10538.1 MAG: Fe-S-binding domain-containing protein [Sphingobacteriia bacterium 35-36-14]OYZ54222.1 MAG: Fe-S-binding domain-containing protein [Sphingobacteriia bacterium 24-36-13]OZA65645.1 MAG: Fe-S-binding domain-containing protein [Sphingobacteriia bacterium 39-36-14]MBT9484644.1 (2Fe-2S)-binding protein [Sediminibacterium sp.]HQS23722.1 2Fe-2S iron-sulfur cluster-binding protein [Sediminibacterium sp.]